ncbi:unnamed protein product [Didymodactylos carnosus]|uniref:Uncharacterized protein n=1 Tax=Didymodactylos carnosus TaxID=1234261 RepID=A0A814G2V0_9BILA|nr:unnamed protein product [Didymodactylos carnosus]CAF1280263.1 unnamed protein product [Didymodactylos carnosus]CAF3762533.1 unnamed protein product [Didymodactylos carnosus]CAF4085107.1 unnamed protein product [Didymodactylos carnosus]
MASSQPPERRGRSSRLYAPSSDPSPRFTTTSTDISATTSPLTTDTTVVDMIQASHQHRVYHNHHRQPEPMLVMVEVRVEK